MSHASSRRRQSGDPLDGRQAWDILLACQGQLRPAPSGHVIGIDMDAALTLATARGHDLKVLSELLPAPRPVLSRRCAPTRADPIEA